ncbi:MAG: hypothetical protein IPK61_15310 [Saprospiraceae bacterium]|nr:hypothetical protein [Saprospiraceae bacterium]
MITVPMPANGCVTIWAKDLDRGSYDNCTPQSRLKFYFDGDTSATSKTICCSDFVANGANDELIVDVEMWVEDLEGNTDYCKTVIIVQDNQNICDDTQSLKGRINGDLRTESNDVTNPVKMELYENGNMMLERTGSPYTFGDLKLATTYVVKPTRTEDPSNGVTTADIVKIQEAYLRSGSDHKPIQVDCSRCNKQWQDHSK